VKASGDIYTSGDIIANGNITAENIIANGNITAGNIEITNKANFAGGTYIDNNGGMTFPDSKTWIGYGGDSQFANGVIYIYTNGDTQFAKGNTLLNANGTASFVDGKFTIDIDGNVKLNSINNYLKVETNNEVRLTVGKMERQFSIDQTPMARDTIHSNGGLVISANNGNSGLYLEGGQFYLLGGEIEYVGAIGVNEHGKIINVDSSSERYKENITEDYDEKLNPENLYKIPVKQFNYKDEYKDITFNPDAQIGLIAEDVDKYFPSACCYNKQGRIEGWHDRMIIPAMLKLIQNQKSDIDTLYQKYHVLVKELDAIKLKLDE
jgi:hypothetical protein